MKTTITADVFNALLANLPSGPAMSNKMGLRLDAVNAVATDGYAMMIAPITWSPVFGEAHDCEPTAITIEPPKAKAPKNGEVIVAHEPGKDITSVTYFTAKGVEKACYMVSVLTNSYVDYKRVVPTETPQIVMGLNPELLARSTRLMPLGDQGEIVLNITDPRDLVRVNMSNGVTLVAMPMRVS